jgi:hypothetical protein
MAIPAKGLRRPSMTDFAGRSVEGPDAALAATERFYGFLTPWRRGTVDPGRFATRPDE